MRKHRLLLLVFGLFWIWGAHARECSIFSDAEPFLSVEQVECRALTDKTKNQGRPLTLRQLDQARSSLVENEDSETLWGKARIDAINKKVDCMISTGDIKICTCLSEDLPFWMSYLDYITLITAAPDINASRYGLSDAEFSKLSGLVWGVRDQCIAFEQ